MCNDIPTYLIVAAGFYFTARQSLRYLHALQQDEYSGERFLQWFKAHRAFDTRGTAIALLFALLTGLVSGVAVIQLLGALALIAIALAEEDPREHGKVKLSMTPRAQRIYASGIALYAVFLILGLLLIPCSLTMLWVFQLILFQCIPFCLIAGVGLLQPFEDRVQAAFLEDAKRKMRGCAPWVIGVTGSYGKTSVKNALGELMQVTLAPTFWPHGSVNTLMGNTREVREHLSQGHAYAVLEMAAYRLGSIAKQCEAWGPKAGIITAIGVEHLERFGTQDVIYAAKTELARAIPQDGILVVNGDDERCRRAASEHKKEKTFLYGTAESADLSCRVYEPQVSAEGMKFKIMWEGVERQGCTKMLGKAALYNIAAAFTMACALGANPELVLGAIANLEPVKNRLSLQKVGKVMRLNDAYNSNPKGFASALEVLKEFPGGKKILMTPGMVELGAAQFDENRKMGEMAASVCSHAIIVAETNRDALKSGLLAGGMAPSSIRECGTREEAFNELFTLEENGDVTLIENDLTDWYESRSKF